MIFTRNKNPRYFEENRTGTNCGSLAFNIEEWYDLELDIYDDYVDMEDWINSLYEEFVDQKEFSDFYAKLLVKIILEDFKGEIRLVDCYSPLKKDEELIAFRSFIDYEVQMDMFGEPMLDYADFDYHFKVFRDGEWIEKNGGYEVHSCSESDWDCGDMSYISNTYYFAHKILT